jgi:two-component system response regulator
MVVDIKNRFGAAVRSRRKCLGFSQEALAGRAGLHRTYIADIERGARNLSLANIEKLALALELSIPALFSQSDLPSKAKTTGEILDILMVEDDPADVELTQLAFKSLCVSNRVQVVRDGADALEFLFRTGIYASSKSEPQPQLVLLDISLPKVNGLEVLRRIKTDPRTRQIPVIMLTASELSQDIEESRRLGAETYIRKPVDLPRFIQATAQLRLCWALLKTQAVPGGCN